MIGHYATGISRITKAILKTCQKKWIQRTPFQDFRNFSFNLSSRIGPIIRYSFGGCDLFRHMFKLNLPVKDVWRSHHIFIWPWPLIIIFNILDYVHIAKIYQVSVIYDIDAYYVTRFSRMIQNTHYFREYNMTFNDLNWLMTSTVKDIYHVSCGSRHVQQNSFLRNSSVRSLS